MSPLEEYSSSHPIHDQDITLEHPMTPFLRVDRMPHIWCPGCGIGSTVKCFESALEKTGMNLDKVSIVSGIGCTGRVAGYVKIDSFHTTHGRAIPFATGLKLARPDLKVAVFSGDGDLFAIGGNHFIHAARRNIDITVICVNNFIYGMTGGQVAPTTPIGPTCSTMPYGNYEEGFNLPHLVASCGAVYVARWTSLDVKRLTASMIEAVNKKGFSFIEILAPCPTLYLRRNKLGDGIDQLKYYRDNTVVKNGADTRELKIDFQSNIIVGKFIDIEKPTYTEVQDKIMTKTLGDKYKKYEGISGNGN